MSHGQPRLSSNITAYVSSWWTGYCITTVSLILPPLICRCSTSCIVWTMWSETVLLQYYFRAVRFTTGTAAATLGTSTQIQYFIFSICKHFHLFLFVFDDVWSKLGSAAVKKSESFSIFAATSCCCKDFTLFPVICSESLGYESGRSIVSHSYHKTGCLATKVLVQHFHPLSSLCKSLCRCLQVLSLLVSPDV